MTNVLMPKLSDSMERGTVLSWLKISGDEVAVGDDLLEIETDKSTVPYAAEAAGTLQIIAEEGATIDVGAVIARIGAATAQGPPRPRPGMTEAAAAPSVSAPSNGAVGASRAGGTPRATPIARRVAAAHGLSPEDISGSGPLGRITRADVLRHAGLDDGGPELPSVRATPPPRTAEPRSAPARPLVTNGTSPVVRRQPSRMQAVIAQRMALAKATIPHFQVQTEVAMGAVLALRAELQQAVRSSAPSVNDFIVKAAALALRDHPLANGSYVHDTFVLHDAINVGIAVAVDDGLLVPTIVDADIKSLGEIGREARRLASAARDGTVVPADLENGTFTISNLGMFGMTAIFPVINPPQAAILGVGAARECLSRVGGEIVDTTKATLTLSCDHRILYGAEAAGFLSRIRELLECPLMLAL